MCVSCAYLLLTYFIRVCSCDSYMIITLEDGEGGRDSNLSSLFVIKEERMIDN